MNETKTAKDTLKAITDFVLNLGKEKVELEAVEVKEEPKVEEVKLEQMKLEDGETSIEADSFEAGQAVFIVNEDERIALPIGEYKLSDGRMLVISEEGLIDSIGEAPAAEEAEVEASSNPELEELKEQIKALLSKTEENETKVKEVETKLRAVTSERDELQKKVDEIPDAKPIVNAPETKPVDLSKLTPLEVYRIKKNQ